MLENRKNCPMRHENGNCLPCGGFCLTVNNEICEALHNAYQHGYLDSEKDGLYDMPAMGGFHDWWKRTNL